MNKTMGRHPGQLLTLFFLAAAVRTFGAQINVPADQPTIQAGINAAVNGDTVLVAPGTYNESITIAGKDIVVISSGGPNVTFIDAHRTNRVVTLTGSMGRSTRLDGFTIRNGNGGVLVNGPSATIANNVITTNAGLSGIGVDVEFCSALVVSNTISRNYNNGGSGGIGGGIYVGGAAAAEIVHNVINNNANGGIALFAAGTPIIRENVITGNTNSSGYGWAGIYLANHADALIINNVIFKNRGNGIESSVPSGNRGPYIINNTIVDNQGNGILSDGFDQSSLIANNVLVTYSNFAAMYVGNFDSKQPILKNNDFYAPVGTNFGGLAPNQVGTNGNMSFDPAFVSTAGANYHPGSSSLCINSGESGWVPASITNDMDVLPRKVGSVDLGAYEVQNPGSIISYAWLQAHGLPFNGSADFADPDGDGMSNWQEWRCDTDPSSSASALKIISVSRASGTNTVTWESVNTRAYYLQRATNLALANPFLTVATNLAGQGSTTTFKDSASGGGPFFYRIYVP